MNPDPSAHVTDPVDPTTSTAFLASLSKEASHAGQEATVPYVASCCGAQYCYYCIAGALLSWEQAKKENEGMNKDNSQGWSCLRCAKPVLEIKRWTGDEGYAEAEKMEQLSEK